MNGTKQPGCVLLLRYSCRIILIKILDKLKNFFYKILICFSKFLLKIPKLILIRIDLDYQKNSNFLFGSFSWMLLGYSITFALSSFSNAGDQHDYRLGSIGIPRPMCTSSRSRNQWRIAECE